MSVNRYHGTLNGVQFRIVQGDGYRRFFSRQTVDEQVSTGMPARVSRSDQQRFYQTSWGGGSAWWRPLITPDTADVYQYSRGIDSWTQPGSLRPLNGTTANTATSRGMTTTVESPMVVAPMFSPTTLIGVSSSQDGSSHQYARYWNGSAWVNSTGTFGAGYSTPWDLAYNPGDKGLYVLSSGSMSRMTSLTSSSATQIGGVTTAPVPSYGASLVQGLTGEMHLYTGNVLKRVNSSDSLVEVTDDGLGFDVIENMNNTGTLTLSPYKIRLATASAEGIFYVKNIMQQGQPQPWLFRVERDAAGNIISIPIATLPVGTLAISIGFAAGIPMVVATYEWGTALANDGTHYTTELWAPVGGTLGLLGKFYPRDPDNFGTEAPTETVAQFLGSHEGLALFGSTKGVWGYDTVRGGLHKLWEYTPTEEQEHSFLQWTEENKLLTSSVEIVDQRGVYDVKTSTLGTDDDSMTLYSNWFDFGLPGEDKIITKVKTFTDETGNAATNQWRVNIISDAGTETDINHDHVNVQEKETTGLSLSGERFRYRLIYETTSATADPAVLTGIFITAETGEMIQGWQLRVDGTQFINVEGAPQHPLKVFDDWVALADNSSILSYTDSYEAFDAAEQTTYNVKVQSVSINKENPNESIIEVVLIRAD